MHPLHAPDYRLAANPMRYPSSLAVQEPQSPGDPPTPLYGGSSTDTPPRLCSVSSEAVPQSPTPQRQLIIQPCSLKMERTEAGTLDSFPGATEVVAETAPSSAIPICASQRQIQPLVLGLAKAAPAPPRRLRGSVVLFLPCAAVILVVAAARTFFRQRRSNP